MKKPCSGNETDQGSGERHHFTAAILNGGKAMRYGGADKQSLRFGNTTIGMLLAFTLREEAEELLIVGRPHPMYDAFADGQHEDIVKGRGPLEGLYLAMRHASQPWILLCAVDMPFVSPLLIRRLFEVATFGNHEVVLSEFNGVHEPFSAFYRRDLVDALAVYLESQSSLSLWNFIQTRRFAVLPSSEVTALCDAELVFQNINDPNSYAHALEAAKKRGFPFKARI